MPDGFSRPGRERCGRQRRVHQRRRACRRTRSRVQARRSSKSFGKQIGTTPNPYAAYGAQAMLVMLQAVAKRGGERAEDDEGHLRPPHHERHPRQLHDQLDRRHEPAADHDLQAGRQEPQSGQDAHSTASLSGSAGRDDANHAGGGTRLPRRSFPPAEPVATDAQHRTRARPRRSAGLLCDAAARRRCSSACSCSGSRSTSSRAPSYFFTISFIGLTNGAVYALVALGYTLVYGILELINFAHGDVFMLGGMFSATMIISAFHLGDHPATGIAHRCHLRVARSGDGRLRPDQCDGRARRLPAAARSPAARAADHRDRHVVHPPGRRARLERPVGYTSVPHILPRGNVFSFARRRATRGRS